MTITQAQTFISRALKAGWLSDTRARWYSSMIRRTKAYGHSLSWKRQGEMRDNLILDNAELGT